MPNVPADRNRRLLPKNRSQNRPGAGKKRQTMQILETIAVTVWILFGLSFYLVFLRRKAGNPETTQHLHNNLPTNKPKTHLDTHRVGVALRENPNPADKQIQEIKALIDETTKRLKELKIEP